MLDLAVARTEADTNPTVNSCLADMEHDFATNHWWRFAAEKADFPIAKRKHDLALPSKEEFNVALPMFHWREHPWTPVDRTVILAMWCSRHTHRVTISPILSSDSSSPWAPQTSSLGFLMTIDQKDIGGTFFPPTPFHLTNVTINWQHTSERHPLSMDAIHTTLTNAIQTHGDHRALTVLSRLIEALDEYLKSCN